MARSIGDDSFYGDFTTMGVPLSLNFSFQADNALPSGLGFYMYAPTSGRVWTKPLRFTSFYPGTLFPPAMPCPCSALASAFEVPAGTIRIAS